MKDALKRGIVAAGLAFSTTAVGSLVSTEAEACRITVWAKSPDDPLKVVPKRHSKSWYYIQHPYTLKGASKFGAYNVGTDFVSAAGACAKEAKDFKKKTNAARATWEMHECNLVRLNEMSPAARKKWTGQVERVCFKEHTVK